MILYFTLFAFLLPAAPDQSFRLEPGDFRWFPLTVKKTPTTIDCRFDVLEGDPSVHAELLPMSEFRRFDRGRDHETLAVTTKARTGEFRRVIQNGGQYAVIVVNDRKARAAVVSLRVATDIKPDADDVARTLPPGRRLTVVLAGLAFFFVTVTWAARRLVLAMRAASRSG